MALRRRDDGAGAALHRDLAFSTGFWAWVGDLFSDLAYNSLWSATIPLPRGARGTSLDELKDLTIGVIGLGHVGLPTALGLADLGWSVVGADDDDAKARGIAEGRAPFYEPGLDLLLRKGLDTGKFQVAPNGAAAARRSTVLMVCVGTPQRENGSADLSRIESAGRTIAANLDGYKLIVEKSTTPVQTADRLRQSIIRYSRRRSPDTGNGAAPEFDVAANPEFLREGTALDDFFNPDRIVIGTASQRAADLLSRIYQPLFDRAGRKAEEALVVTSVNTAEIIKHASNAFLASKVSFINMVADLCEATGADVTDVAHGLGLDPRIGPHFLEAGIGFGGYCLPKDIRAFQKVAQDHGVDFSLMNEVDSINRRRIDAFIEKIRKALWVIRGKSIALWGLSFKPGTNDIRDAPSVSVVERLMAEGALLRLHDPQAMGEFQTRFPASPPQLVYADTAESAAEGVDAVALVTEWPEYGEVDLRRLRGRMSIPLIIDGRNMMDPEAVRSLGFEYYGVGRP